MEDSIFTKIINKEIPAFIIEENNDFIAFLDAFPLAKGHTLVIPKKQIDYIFDLEDKHLSDLHVFSKRIAKAVEKAVDCKRIGIAVVGLEVPHAHIHLVPINKVSDIDFSRPKLSFSEDELKKVLADIKSFL